MPAQRDNASLADPAIRMPDYGIDAPGFVRGFALTAVGLATVGLVAIAMATRRRPFTLAAIPILALALAPASLGLSMRAYAFVGKHRLRDHLLRQRTWRGDEAVLDVGSGRGLMAIGAAQRAPFGRTIALDIWSVKDLTGNTPDGLRANTLIEGVETTVQIVHGDARTLPCADDSIDVVTSVFCIHNIEPESEHARACAEIARVLKPGGMAMIADFPGVDPYVGPLRAAGLHVDGPFRAESIALSIAGYLVATKPPG